MASVELLEEIESNSTISKGTKDTYRKASNSIIRAAIGMKGTDKIDEVLSRGGWDTVNNALYDIIMHPKKYQTVIAKSVENLKSLNLCYNTIKALIKHSNDPSLLAIKESWDGFAQKADEELRIQAEDHVVTERQVKGMVPWTDVLKKLAGLEKGSMEHLLLCTYVSFTRRQRDYSSVRIYTDSQDKIDSSKCCYIHLSSQRKHPYIHIGEGKTIKHYGIFEWDLPKDMLESLLISLKNDPREYLFGDKTDDGFRQWCNSTLKRIFKNDSITVNILRHSHAEYVDNLPGVKVSQRRIEAKKMGHSILKQLEYNLQLDNKPKKEMCYRKDPKTNKLVEGECIFFTKEEIRDRFLKNYVAKNIG